MQEWQKWWIEDCTKYDLAASGRKSFSYIHCIYKCQCHNFGEFNAYYLTIQYKQVYYQVIAPLFDLQSTPTYFTYGP